MKIFDHGPEYAIRKSDEAGIMELNGMYEPLICADSVNFLYEYVTY
jgi:hypothetical protein